MKQKTLKNTCKFEGKGLHTGEYARVWLRPSDENSGIVFRNVESGVEIPALAQYVSRTSRCTTLSKDNWSISTIEHIMSALTGLGVDNALVEVEGIEMPILDGSARPYVEAVNADGLLEQSACRKYLELESAVEIRDENSGSTVRITPSDHFSIDVEVDFGSRVLGVQKAHWDETVDYASQFAPCRTFCFFHELEQLASMGLVKGGDVENAIVVVENPVSSEQLSRMAGMFAQPELEVTAQGYLNNLVLHFPDECGRHKLLDILGDIRLAGGFLKAKVEAYKPGHGINTAAALKVQHNLK